MSNKMEDETIQLAEKRAVVPKLRFPEFRDAKGWKVITLQELSVPVIERVGQRKLTPVSISAGIGFVPQAEKFGRDISGKQYKLYTLVSDGDFVYNKGNSLKFPEGCVYLLQGWGQVAAPNVFICFRLKQGCSNGFFQNVFEQNFHGKQLKRHITSGARSNGLLNISKESFFGVKIPTPTSGEQQKIADCLASLDDLITAQVQKLATLKTHKNGLMQQLFPAEGETLPKLRFSEFLDAGEWEEKTLGQVAKYENGKAHEQDISESGDFVVVNSKFISTEGEVRKFTNTAFCIADKEDILMVLSDVPNGRAIAKCFFVDSDDLYTVNQRICKLTPYKAVSTFLFYVLNRNSYFLAFDDSVKQTNLKKDDVLDCPVLLPKDRNEQQKIADCLTSLDDLIANQAQKLDTLKTHKKGLMQQLFPLLNDDCMEAGGSATQVTKAEVQE
jgi:type I restriction enzyme S subunit